MKNNLRDRKYFFETNQTHFSFEFILSSYYVLKNQACECITTSDFNNRLDIKYETGDVVFGSIELCKRAFEKSGIETPSYIGYPEELNHFYGRDINVMNYDEAMKVSLPFFIKPKEEVKRFTGVVLEKEKWRTITLNGHEDIEFYISPVIDILSEWRVFVHSGNIYGCQCYKGDRLKFPDKHFIEDVKDTYEDSGKAPVSYTIDVGVKKDGSTFVIELNDMWGTGIYGAPDYEYTMAYIDRWLEIVNK